MRRRWWFIIGAVVLIVVAGGVVAWQLLSARQAAAQVPVEQIVVQRGSLEATVDGSGSIAPAREVTLSFSSGGRVAEVLVAEGEVVQAGQPLVRLETDELELQVAQAEASLRQAELDLEALLASPDEDEVQQAQDALEEAAAALRLAQINYQAAQDSRTVNETLEDARSAYEEALNTYNYWLDQYNQGKATYWWVDRSQQRLEDAELALRRVQQQADQTLESAAAELQQAVNTYQQAKAALDELLAGPDEQEVELARLQVEQAQASLKQAQLQLEQATLNAPFDGVVTSLDATPGETVSGEVVTISDLSALEVEINLDETDIPQVAIGQKARVYLDAFPDAELEGEVVYVALSAKVESGVVLYPVRVRLAATDLPIRPGMTADVEIITASRENVLLVPLRALQNADGQYFVFRRTGTPTAGAGQGSRQGPPANFGIERVVVTVGASNGTWAEVVDGLSEGDVVVVMSQTTTEGTTIRMPGGGMFGPMFGGGRP